MFDRKLRKDRKHPLNTKKEEKGSVPEEDKSGKTQKGSKICSYGKAVKILC